MIRPRARPTAVTIGPPMSPPAPSPSTPAEKGPPAHVWLAAAVLVALVVASFWPALSAGLVAWDDADNVLNNTHIRGFTPENLRWMLTAFHVGHWHPLTWLTFALDYALWGLQPLGYHLTNILLHAANTVLLFLLTRRLVNIATGAAGSRLTLAAAIGAALWGVHPLRVESVAWVTERRDVLSTLFLLLAAMAYVNAVELGSARLRSGRWYGACLLFLVLSCLSKAWGMSFFVLVLVLDFYPLRRLPNSPLAWFSRDALRVLLEKTPLIAVGLATAYLASRAQYEGLAAKSLDEWPVAARVVQSFYGLWFYVEKTFAPADLSPLYQLPAHIDPRAPRYLLAYTFVAAAIVVVVWQWKRRPAIAASAAIYAVLLLPVLGILQSGEQFVADRYSYLAVMPFSMLFAAIVLRLLEHQAARRAAGEESRAGTLAILASLVLTAAAGALAFAQSTIWYSTEKLWAHAAQVTPSAYVLSYYGGTLEHQNRPDDALALYKAAITANPNDGRAWFSYASLVQRMGDRREAERAYAEAAKHLSQAFQAYQNLGILYMEEGRRPEAIEQFRLAAADVERGGRRKLSGGPFMVLGLALEEDGRTEEAIATFRKALAFPDTHEQAEQAIRRLGANP